jgi:uncharacterized circularly permuted ATP-grasp superfamily protein
MQWLKEQPPKALSLMSADAESIFRRLGITFAVYGSDEGTEKLIPFDVIPRIISAPNGAAERASSSACGRSTPSSTTSITARRSSRPAASPKSLILQNSAFCPEMMGFDPPRGVYSHIIGVDIVRIGRTTSTCSRTICARLRASPTCSRTARR